MFLPALQARLCRRCAPVLVRVSNTAARQNNTQKHIIRSLGDNSPSLSLAAPLLPLSAGYPFCSSSPALSSSFCSSWSSPRIISPSLFLLLLPCFYFSVPIVFFFAASYLFCSLHCTRPSHLPLLIYLSSPSSASCSSNSSSLFTAPTMTPPHPPLVLPHHLLSH